MKSLKINYKTEQINWHIIYKQLAKLLYDFSLKYGENSGRELFDRCVDNYEFHQQNRWFKNYLKWEVNSLEPVHIFASFNYAGIERNLRIRKLKFYFEILGSSLEYENINFQGIPSPNITRIMSARNIETQIDIWDFFCNVMENGYKGLDDIFNKVYYWYGLQVPSISIFLFWIDSDTFFPLDKNTTRLLEVNEIDIPKTTQEYIEIIEQNINDDGIFRELTRVAYE